jgi:hypothetical protein
LEREFEFLSKEEELLALQDIRIHKQNEACSAVMPGSP